MIRSMKVYLLDLVIKRANYLETAFKDGKPTTIEDELRTLKAARSWLEREITEMNRREFRQ